MTIFLTRIVEFGSNWPCSKINFVIGWAKLNIPIIAGIDRKIIRFIVFSEYSWNSLNFFSINNEEIALDLKYFPNPVNDKLYINYINDIDISVFDINGRKILQTNNKTIDFSDFDYGIYLLQIKDIISNNYKTIKILKE